jgi:hypothetical protein
MGSFWGGSSSEDKIPHRDLDDILKRMPNLREKERQYIIGHFDQYEHGHISRDEIRRAVREMKNDTSDGIDSYKAGKLEDHLFGHLDSLKDAKNAGEDDE